MSRIKVALICVAAAVGLGLFALLSHAASQEALTRVAHDEIYCDDNRLMPRDTNTTVVYCKEERGDGKYNRAEQKQRMIDHAHGDDTTAKIFLIGAVVVLVGGVTASFLYRRK